VVRYEERGYSLPTADDVPVSLLHRHPSAQTLVFYEPKLKPIELGRGRNDPDVQAMFSNCFIPGGNTQLIASFNEHPRLSCGGLRTAVIVRANAGQDARELGGRVLASTLVLQSESDAAVPLGLGHVKA
jgi:hypothetical protein